MAEIRPLDASMLAEIRNFQGMGAEVLEIEQTLEPRAVVSAIDAAVGQLKADESVVSEDVIIALGVLLGEQYVRQFGWHWGEVAWDGGEENGETCVLPADNSLSINPIWWVNDVYTTGRPANFLLNFNMVAAGRVPPARPGEAIPFN